MNDNARRRNTKQRRVILEELKKLNSHPSATELYEVVRQRIPNISLGTVYRNLDLLANSGMIQKLNTGQNEARFDGITKRHYHVYCAQCGKIEDIRDSRVELSTHGLDEIHGFDIISHQLQFIGICPDCRDGKLH